MNYRDCSSLDVERLLDRASKLALLIQQTIHTETTTQDTPIGEQDFRDDIIVGVVALDLIVRNHDSAIKKSTGGSRFIRSIRASLSVARKFGTGRLRDKDPKP